MYYENEIWSNTIVLYDKNFYRVLTQCWSMETSSGPFYDFIKVPNIARFGHF